MEILKAALEDLWQVVVVGLVLGAGLPALFALGLRSLCSGRVPVAAGPAAEGEPSPPGAPHADRLGPPTPPGIVGAVLCFAVVALAVAFGIVVIIFGKQLFG